MIAPAEPKGQLTWLDMVHVGAMAVASDGTVAIVGSFRDRITAGATTLNSAGEDDAYVAVVERSGALRWITAAGSSLSDGATGVRFSQDAKTVVVGGGREGTHALDFGDREVASEVRHNWIAAFDASSGATKWGRGIGSSMKTGVLRIGRVDSVGRIVFMIGDCSSVEPETERLESASDFGAHACVGALDLAPGRVSFLREMGPTLEKSSIAVDDRGLWFSAKLTGRPDVGSGKVRSGNGVLVRYDYE